MCGIVGLFAKTPEIEQRLGEHLAAMLVQMDDRGPDSAGVAVYRDPVAAGSSKLTLYSADPLQDWAGLASDLGRALGAAAVTSVRSSHAVLVVDADAAEAEDWVRQNRPELRVMSAGSVIEIYKEVGRPHEFATPLRARRLPRDARARAHAHGHGEQGHHRGLAPVLDRVRPVPRPQRVALEPQPPAARAAARGDPLPDRERHRGRRRLSRLAPARGRQPRTGAGRLPRRSRRLLHLPRRHRGRVRRAARPDRVQAGRAGGDRRLGRDGLRVARDRRPPGRRRRAHVGAGAGRRRTRGRGRPSRERRHRAGGRGRRSRGHAAA